MRFDIVGSVPTAGRELERGELLYALAAAVREELYESGRVGVLAKLPIGYGGRIARGSSMLTV